MFIIYAGIMVIFCFIFVILRLESGFFVHCVTSVSLVVRYVFHGYEL